MDAALRMEGVTRSFAGGTGLHGVSMVVPQGGVYGFLGPNGAGKTTSIRIYNGLLAADAGRVELLGRPLSQWGPDVHRVCGVVTESAQSYGHLSGRENLRFFAHMFDVADAESRAAQLLERLGLTDAADRPVKDYSTGMKKRLALCRALLHRPRVLFLDEPTNGLDPESARDVTAVMAALARDEGVTVLLCTHLLRHAQDSCTRYGFIHQGRLIAEGSMEELLAERRAPLTLRITGTQLPDGIPGTQRVDVRTLTAPLGAPADAAAVLRRVLDAGGNVEEARQERWDLEQLYFSFQQEARHGGHA